ncbi:hypothetical protein [Sedimentitalea todarodis]|uniref:Uncharacterized protein n=1 Tax=Sedimentitalea todarodis TaxID=1631240 RepID=A0ABU3V9D1_9RHOB|nr:hypothetical protein [Sedimentitalea todarodis]MDU9002787.1 hypothetical protein [Sedimentitalea todarodis]
MDALIDLNIYCEREGLAGISDHLIQAIESIAPTVRNLPITSLHPKIAPEHLKVLAVLEQRG